jgi:hypothetical protein
MAQDWSVHAVVYFCSAIDDLSGAVFYWPLDMELADMTFTDKDYEDARRLRMDWMDWHQKYTANGWAKPVRKYSIKHPVVAAALIFYAIGFLVGYGVGKV